MKRIALIASITIAVAITPILTQGPTPGGLRFASGFQGGTYDKIAKSIASLPGLSLNVRTSNGTIENLKNIKDGKIDLAFGQMDILFKFALRSEKYNTRVKVLLPVYNEEVHVLARKKIRTLEQLEERRVAIGAKKSGSSATSRIILNAAGVDEDLLTLDRSHPDKALKALLKKKGKVSALFVVAGAPVDLFSGLPKKAGKKLRLLSVDETLHGMLLKEGLPYSLTTIKKGTYKWLKSDVETLSVGSALIARAELPDQVVTKLLTSIFQKREELKKKHRKWREFDPGLAKFYLNAYSKYFHPAAIASIRAAK